MRRLVAVALLALFAAPPIDAQKKRALPKRPKLQATADTNDAEAYFHFGQLILERDPRAAADAFYWATRLNPNGANAFYGQHAALLLSDAGRLARHMDRDPRKRPADDLLQTDSLYARALMLNPFLYRKYEQIVLRRYYENTILKYSSGAYPPSLAQIDRSFAMWIFDAGPEIKGWAAYCAGRFGEALRHYGDAVKHAKYKAHLRAERGRIYYYTGQHDSAVAEIGLAIDELRKQDSKDLVILYSSKALLEHSVAKIHEERGDIEGARAAYGRALEEDLAFYPAHVNLGMLALQLGDTTTGVSELQLAVEIKGDDPMLRLFYGYLLAYLKRYAEAEAQLTKAIELEPYYARSYQLLAQVYDAQQKRPEAIAHYEAYLARAAVRDGPRDEVARQVEALRTLARGRAP
jgi:tetratricopeptide (TPR) repeat protein